MSLAVVSILALITSCAALFRAYYDHRVLASSVKSLRLKTAELNRLIQERGQLASEIAHEIKNPITAIQSSADALDHLLGDKIDPDLRRSLHYIREYSDYLLRLLTDFLDVSRCEAGAVRARPEPVSVSESMECVVAVLTAYSKKKHIVLSAHPPAEECFIWADPRHVKQILFNLVHNALKFTPDYGSIKIGVATLKYADTISISVHNSGPAIPSREQSEIFNPYRQYDKNQPNNDAGVGLGLALCKKLAELGGGDIFVDSDVNGTTFTFTFPKARDAFCTTPSAPQLHVVEEPMMFQPLLGQTFLLVDTDSEARNAIAEMIETWGGLVDQVEEAIQAVEAVTSKSYDAIMVDNSTDGLNGYELANLLREPAHAQGTTIVLATDKTHDSQLADECGADRTIQKPMRAEHVLQSLISAGKCQVTH